MHRILCGQFFSPQLQIYFHCLLISVASDERLAAYFIEDSVFQFLHFACNVGQCEFILPGVCPASQVCIFMSCIRFGKSLAVVASNNLSAPSCLLSMTPLSGWLMLSRGSLGTGHFTCFSFCFSDWMILVALTSSLLKINCFLPSQVVLKPSSEFFT